MTRRPVLLTLLPLAVACAPAKQQDGIDTEAKQPFGKVSAAEVVTLTGTEPFWNLRIEGGMGTWSTPESQPGTRLALQRFAGNNGMGFSGMLGDKPLVATLTPGTCSDGMSDRRYPYVATIALGGKTWEGCGYTTSEPFTGDKAP